MGKLTLEKRVERAKAKLIEMGVVLVDGWDCEGIQVFAISGEHEHGDWSDIEGHPEKCLIVDYYAEFGTEISQEIIDVLRRYGLAEEWYNAGVLGVYDNEY